MDIHQTLKEIKQGRQQWDELQELRDLVASGNSVVALVMTQDEDETHKGTHRKRAYKHTEEPVQVVHLATSVPSSTP